MCTFCLLGVDSIWISFVLLFCFSPCKSWAKFLHFIVLFCLTCSSSSCPLIIRLAYFSYLVIQMKSHILCSVAINAYYCLSHSHFHSCFFHTNLDISVTNPYHLMLGISCFSENRQNWRNVGPPKPFQRRGTEELGVKKPPPQTKSIKDFYTLKQELLEGLPL